MRRGTRFVAVGAGLAVVALLPLERVAAQRTANTRSGGGAIDSNSARLRGAPPREAEGETDPFITDGAPRTFRIVSVPVPKELLAGKGPIEYSVVAVGSLRILGSRQGSIADAPERRDVVFTIAIPSAAIARRVAVGYVTFSVEGLAPIRVPVNLDVASVHRVTLEAKRAVVGVRPGERIMLAFALQNNGNTDDTLAVSLEAPIGWTRATASTVVVPAGAQIDHTVSVAVPPDVGTGSWFVDLVASRAAKEITRSHTTLEVAPPFSTPIRAGPAVTAGLMSVFSPDGMGGTVETLALDGALTEGLRINGRYTSPVASDGITDRAISQLGYSSHANSIALRAKRWGLGVGTTGLGAAELAGAGIFGRGVSVTLRPGDLALQATAVTPVSATNRGGDEQNVAMRGDWATRRGTLSVSASHLRDSEFGTRQLDALAVGATGLLGGASVALEAGPRRYADGSGLGALAEVRGSNESGDFSLRALQAPGGSGAFAASRSGLFASGGHRLGSRVDLAASAWRTDDGNVAFSSLRSTGWSMTPRLELSRVLSIGADVHSSSYDSRGAENAFGTSMNSYGLRAGVLNRWVQARTDVAWSRTFRDAEAEGTMFRTATDRATVQGQLDVTTTRGRFGLGSAIETSTTDVAEVSRQGTLDIHVEQFMPLSRYPGLRMYASVQRFGSSGIPAVVMARSGFELPMRGGFRFRLELDHSGLSSTSGHSGGTVVSTRIERTMGLPFIDRRTEGGFVFQDLNGNGRRDVGEPGFGGAILRRGAESAMSDRDGGYRLLRDNRDPIELDARSLPTGWILSPRTTTGPQTEFGVVPTAALEVTIAAANDSSTGSPGFRFGSVTVALVDSSGRKWVVRTETRHALFDALPAGSYRLEAEAAETSEPLLLDSPGDVDVVAGRMSRAVVMVRRRPVRLFRSGAAPAPPTSGARP